MKCGKYALMKFLLANLFHLHVHSFMLSSQDQYKCKIRVSHWKVWNGSKLSYVPEHAELVFCLRTSKCFNLYLNIIRFGFHLLLFIYYLVLVVGMWKGSGKFLCLLCLVFKRNYKLGVCWNIKLKLVIGMAYVLFWGVL